MNTFTTYLQGGHWLALVLIVLALAAGVALLVTRRLYWLIGGAALLALGVGGLGMVPGEYGMYTLLGVLFVLAVLLTIVFTTGLWWAAAGYSVGAIALLGGSAWLLPTAGVLFQEFGAFLWSLEPLESWWLLLLLLVPVMIWWSYPSSPVSARRGASCR